jgi:hypothetical protein
MSTEKLNPGAMQLRPPVVRRGPHHETEGSERIDHEDRILTRGRIFACVHKRHSEQSRAGMTDECFGVAAVGLEHLERTPCGSSRSGSPL